MVALHITKYYIKCLAIILLSVFSFHIYAENTLPPIRIETKTSTTKAYTGTVVAIQTDQYASGGDGSYYGYVDYVAKVGSLIYPEITDMNGSTVEGGTIIIQMRKDFWADVVLSDESDIYAAKANLLTATQDYNRYKDLTKIKTKVVSVEKYQQIRAQYYDALSALNVAKATLLKDQIVLKSCTQHAPFAGIVNKVYFSGGRASANPQTIEISQLDPIGIKIKMPREEAKKIKISSLVKIYKPNTNIVCGIYSGNSILKKDGIMLQTENKLESFYIKAKHRGKIIQNVSDAAFVDLFYNLNPYSRELSVSSNSINKDDKGYYVWKLIGAEAIKLDNKHKSIFKVKKTYIVPDNLKREMGGYTYYVALKKSGELKFNDLVLTKLPYEQLKNGDFVNFVRNRYIFMPGDTVKVSIDY
ncbi:MAG TPA: hypothetical protein QF753_14205 [Victivallales bacterium]|nr:hypothetical protein [Victivallales bacterium]